tara:strand:- start:247 stop:489 length:243 start_codon:yes stop_codon:yes gene_type:complete
VVVICVAVVHFAQSWRGYDFAHEHIFYELLDIVATHKVDAIVTQEFTSRSTRALGQRHGKHLIQLFLRNASHVPQVTQQK